MGDSIATLADAEEEAKAAADALAAAMINQEELQGLASLAAEAEKKGLQ